MDQEIIQVRDADGLKACAERLQNAGRIAVDSESNSMYVYQEQVCYLQICSGSGVFLIDTLAIRDLEPLRAVFANPKNLALLHGADYDVVCLGRDFNIKFERLFDTMLAAQILGKTSLGLAGLCLEYYDVELDKSLTKHDWGRRPLEDKYISYLIDDVIYLEGLVEKLQAELEAADLVEEFDIECARVSNLEWSAKPFDPDGYWKIKGVRDLSLEAKAVMKALWCAREAIAENEGLPPFKIAHNEALMAAARSCAATESTAAGRAFRGQTWRRYGGQIATDIEAALAGKVPVNRPARGERPARHIQIAHDAIRSWRRKHAEKRGVPPLVVLPNHALNEILQAPPASRDELAALPGFGAKRDQIYGKELFKIIQEQLLHS